MNLDAMRRLEEENEPEPETIVEVDPPEITIPLHMLPRHPHWHVQARRRLRR